MAARTVWQWLAAALDRSLRARCLRREQEALDGAALRDLGVSRSELGSYQAEAERTAPWTRRRSAIDPLAQYAYQPAMNHLAWFTPGHPR